MLLTLAWRNLWRNRNRTLITMASITGAVLLAVVLDALQKGIFDHLVKNVVGFYTGYVQVHGKGYWAEQTLENSFTLTDSLAGEVRQVPGVAAFAPRLESFMLVSNGEKTKGCMVVGIAPEPENTITRLQQKVVAGQFLKENDNTMLLGEELARQVGAKPGDTLVLLGQSLFGSTAAGKFAVGGLLRFGSPELNTRLVYLSLPAAQMLFDAGQNITSLVISPEKAADFQKVASDLKAILPSANFEVMTWEEKMPEIVQHIKTDTAGNYIVIGILYLLIGFGIFSTLLMMLAERRREFGMLVALGMKRGLLARLVLLESVLVSLVGCLAGLALSIPVVLYLKNYPIRLGDELGKVYEKFGFEAVLPALVKPSVFYNQTIIVLAIALVLSAYPVFHILKLKTAEAMRGG